MIRLTMLDLGEEVVNIAANILQGLGRKAEIHMHVCLTATTIEVYVACKDGDPYSTRHYSFNNHNLCLGSMSFSLPDYIQEQ